jgi:large subunit ribosomal protein L6
MPIPIPVKVQVDLWDLLVVKGPHGELRRTIHPAVSVSKAENRFLSPFMTRQENQGASWAVPGLDRQHGHGVSRGFEKVLDIVGVGYRAELAGRTATFHLGYSHPVSLSSLPDRREDRKNEGHPQGR